MSTLAEQINAEWEKYQEEKKDELYPNIMLLGPSGAGKSSLINKIFDRKIAAVSNVAPKTEGYKNVYWGKDCGQTINLIDTAGYEIGQGALYLSDVIASISEGIGEVPTQPIHIIWYCVPVTNERVQDMDFEILEKLMSLKDAKIGERICIVFTKCDEDSEDSAKANALKSEIDNNIHFSLKSFETSSLEGFEPELDLLKLIQWSAGSIDDNDLRDKFVAAQMADLALKRDNAQKIISTSALAAAGVGAVPLTFSDSVVLVPIQVTMVAKIIDAYGVSNLAKISAATISDVIVSNLGKSLAAALIKLIPIAGPIVGGIINSAVASSMTTAVGFAVSKICYTNIKKHLNGERVIWEEMFATEEFTNLVLSMLKNRN